MATSDQSTTASQASEAFRILRSTVKFAAGERAIRSVLVVDIDPPAPTGVAARLATAFADAGDRTIFIDANPGSATGETPGLSALLRGSPAGDTPAAAAGGVTRIGPGDGLTADLLASEALQTTIAAFVDSGAFVVLSCAPLPQHGDAIAIAPRADATILVVSAGRTRRARAVEARDALERVGARVLGVTLVEGKRRWFW